MSAKRTPDPTAGLQQAVEKLAGAFEHLATSIETASTGGGLGEDRLNRHVRRYMPFYALASIWILMLIILPTQQDDGNTTLGQVASGGVTTNQGFVPSGPVTNSPSNPSNPSSGTTQSIAPQVQSGTIVVPPEVQQLDPLAWDQTGKTRGGFDCKPGVRQLPWSSYAVPCYPEWSGNNGGATHRGVTGDKIVIVDRQFADSASSQAVDAFVQAAGFASSDEFRETNGVFKEYFNTVFELWGRQIEFIEYESEFGDSTAEAQSQGKDGACADADAILETYEPFAVIGDTTHPFGECGAERGMVVFGTGAYYPEKWYDTYHPYLWNGVMECERIAYLNAEYFGKRMQGPAKWAKGLQKDLPRVFGIYVPDNDNYQHCVDIALEYGKENWGVEFPSRYNYALDVSRFPDEAARGIVQFRADGVTTILLACDPLSPIFLTQSARGQEYWPEWVTNSAGLTDVEGFARLWDQESIQWSLFGMSQLGDLERILGPEGEGTIAYKRATGTDIPNGTQTEYYALLRYFSVLQAAGPNLNPNTMAEGRFRSPPGGAPNFEVGYTSYQDGPDGTPGATDHTAVDDIKEIYWLCTSIGAGDAEGSSRCNAPEAYDGAGGVYISTFGGKRFRPGELPEGEPPVFPEYDDFN